ncbi:MAG: type I glutamate--ammonia ligase, partial [Spirochaetales bacterium]|nr:type I glutamate--ammonia ligase [Spirochaetales bacterium]
KKSGTQLSARTECEFYLFKQDAEGNPTDIPMDRASYFEASPIDRGENIRREICLTMDQMGINYIASHHEKGPGQNEIRFSPAPLLGAADHLVTFKDIVKNTADRMGLFASFLPKPLFGENGSELAISLCIDNAKAKDRERLTRQMVGGILRRIVEMTIFLNPIANSYERIGTFEAPSAVNYSLGNGSFLVKAHPEAARVKLRSADPSCNPYLACLLLSGAAMEGIRDDVDPDKYNTGCELPDTMNDAIKCAENSTFIRTMIPDVLFERFLQAKRDDWKESSLSGDPMLKAKNMEFPVT